MFQLAEQPPADMAALLKIFHSVPPVIRRRAKELLEVIRDCVKRHLTKTSASSVVDGPSDIHVDKLEISTEVNTILVTDPPVLSNIWSLSKSLELCC